MGDQTRLEADQERFPRPLLAELGDEVAGRDAQEERQHRQRQEHDRDNERGAQKDREEPAQGAGRKPALLRAAWPSGPRSAST